MSEQKEKKKILSRLTVQRLIRDVREMIQTQPLASNGIFYKHDEEDLLKGYAVIFGPMESPYACGCYFFEFEFPVDYPISPPVVYFKTNMEGIRFHPNLYENGKTCLSLLNTWDGEPWTPCQTIRTILLSLFLLFDDYPFFHEPEQNKANPEHKSLAIRFNQVIICANLRIAVMRVMTKHPLFLPYIQRFESEIKFHFAKNQKFIFHKIDLLCSQYPSPLFVSCPFYQNMHLILNYSYIQSQIVENLPLFLGDEKYEDNLIEKEELEPTKEKEDDKREEKEKNECCNSLLK